MSFHFLLKVPATSANLGPGYDTLGVALNLYLTIEVSYQLNLNDSINIQVEGVDKELLNKVPLEDNLILITCKKVLKRFNKELKGTLNLKIQNEIPLSRGLGSSASAIVAGVLLANEIGQLDLNQEQLLGLIIQFETHPDNVVPCLLGGMRVSYVLEGDQLLENKVGTVKVPVNEKVKFITVIPDYPLSTEKARKVLPKTYSISDIVFNLQRLSVLITSLSQPELNKKIIYNSIQDKLHQNYRQELIPGLNTILSTLTFENTKGLLGVCLSGAGPTVLALAIEEFNLIGSKLKNILDKEGNCNCKVLILDMINNGAEIRHLN